MRLKRGVMFSLLILLMVLLAACGGNESPAVSEGDLVLTQAAEIAAQSLTQTAEARPPSPTPEPSTATPTEEPTEEPTTEAIPTNSLEGDQTPTVQPIFTADPNATPTAAPVIQPTSPPAANSANCNYAATFEGVENTPDGTRFPPGKAFTKTWRVKNTGTCTWDRNVDLIWVAAEKDGKEAEVTLGQTSVIPIITTSVAPFEYLDIAVTFVAPTELGTFKVYYMFRAPKGVFGVNDGGSLWLEIVVYDPS